MFLCPNNDPSFEATQECFDKFPLVLSGTREHRFYIPSDTKKKGVFKYVVCFLCILYFQLYNLRIPSIIRRQ